MQSTDRFDSIASSRIEIGRRPVEVGRNVGEIQAVFVEIGEALDRIP